MPKWHSCFYPPNCWGGEVCSKMFWCLFLRYLICVHLLIGTGFRPDLTDIFDGAAFKIPSDNVVESVNETTGVRTFMIQGENPTDVDLDSYISLVPNWDDPNYKEYMANISDTDTEPLVHWTVSAQAAKCLFWNKTEESWRGDGCQVINN